MALVNRPNRAGEVVLYFLCRMAGCRGGAIQARRIEGAAEEFVQMLCMRQSLREVLSARAREWLDTSGDAMKGGVAALETRLAQVNAAIDHVYLDAVRGLLCEEDHVRLRSRLLRERQAIADELAQLRQDEEEGRQVCGAEAVVERFLAQIPQSRAALAALIEKIEPTAEKDLVVTLRCAVGDDFPLAGGDVSRIEKAALDKLREGL